MKIAIAITLGTALAAGLSAGARSFGFSPQNLTLSPWPNGLHVQTWNNGLLENKSHVRNSGAPAQLELWNFSGRVRLANTGKYSPTVAYHSLYLGLGLDSNPSLLPHQLVNDAMSVGMPLGEFAGWGFGVSVGAGYAGNSPFNDPHAVYGMARVSAQHRLSRRNQLDVFLDYNGNRQLLPDAPLPALEIQHKQPHLRWMLGFPDEDIRWRPLPRLVIHVDYQPVVSGEADIDYRLLRWLHVFGKFESSSWAFHLDYYSSTQRLFFAMSRIEGGVRFFAWRKRLAMEVGGGYAFNQALSEGYDARDEQPVSQIANSAFALVTLAVRF